MAWSTPPTWSAGNVVTSAKLTTISDDLNYLKVGAYDAWTAYTPTVKLGATTVTIASNDSAYTLFGKTVTARVRFRFSNLNGGTGELNFSPPVTAKAVLATFDIITAIPYGVAALVDRGTGPNKYHGFVRHQAVTDFRVHSLNIPSITWTEASPITIAAGVQGTGDEFYAQFTYEAA